VAAPGPPRRVLQHTRLCRAVRVEAPLPRRPISRPSDRRRAKTGPGTRPSGAEAAKETPSTASRRLLLGGYERLSSRGHERLAEGLRHGDPHSEASAAYLAKEPLREVHASGDMTQARHRHRVCRQWRQEGRRG